MKQHRTSSLIEAITNTIIGYLLALAGQMILYPLLNISVTLEQNLLIGAVFVGVSLVRSYLLRRAFEHLRVAGVLP